MTKYKIGSIVKVTCLIAILSFAMSIETGLAEPSAVIVVDTKTDELNYPTGGNGLCSLREAIKAANENIVVDGCDAGGSGTDIIYLQEVGTYQLTITGQGEDFGATGDLDIRGSVEIYGNGVTKTVIHGGNIDRVFHLVVLGISVEIHNLTIRNGSISTGTSGGGGILAGFQTTLDLHDCLITDNHTPNLLGGGIDNYAGNVTITNCTVSNNSAEDGGGIYNDGYLFVYQSLISDNDANNHGGGLKNAVGDIVGTAVLENVTITLNNCNVGSGIYSNIPINLTNVTIARNIGTGTGFANNATANLLNTLFVEQTYGGKPNCSGDAGDFNSAGYNLSDDDSCHLDETGDKEDIPALLSTNLQNNGGDTLTYALLENSPAIDGGTNTGCPSIDQRGAIRPGDGNRDGVAVCDIGAFEVPSPIYFPLIFR